MAVVLDRDGERNEMSAVEAGEVLLSYAIAIAEGKAAQIETRDYRQTHSRLFRDPVARKAASKVLARSTSPDLLSSHLRSVATGSGSWQLRRDAAHALIDPVLDALRATIESPLDKLVAETAARLNADSVTEAWARALDRRTDDPGGAITMARTLLESTLKTILDDRSVSYRADDDLPSLYKAVSNELGLAPGDYSEQAFKQILGGANSVVVGLGALRNKAGDAHGAGRLAYRPSARHAALAVNLAGSMSSFLIETHESRES